MTRETLSQSAYRLIKDDILTGRIKEEAVLSERVLAESLNISRTPLRIAISQLEKEGMVDRLDNGVILVRSVTVEQLIEIVKMRQKLESAAAARAANHPLSPELKELRLEMVKYSSATHTNFDAFWNADERFHAAVARAARFTLLPGILAEQRTVSRRCSLTRTYNSFTDQAREHVDIIDAIDAGDNTAAYDAMWAHFTNARSRFLQTFSGT
jgi:DNA-binding GntR family transcriptional regulator